MTARKKQPPLTVPQRLRYGLETALAYLVYGLLRAMPLDMASAFGGAVLGVIGPRMGISRVAYKNLSLALPEKTQAEKEKIVRGMWNNLGRVIGEYPHLHRIHGRVETIGRDLVESRPGREAATIFFGAHVGNWEMNAVAAMAEGIPLHVVYRKPNNPWVDGLLVHARRSGAQGHIPKGRSGARAILSHLRGKGALGILIDQKLNEGISVPFFGYDAMTADAVAQFALSLDCPLHGARIERLHGAHFRMTVYPALEIRRTGDRKADALRIMTEANKMIEDWIRARPEQWLWIHKRWPENPQKSSSN
jgi:KDO2-lipid IV(A) lauroyltransferase